MKKKILSLFFVFAFLIVSLCGFVSCSDSDEVKETHPLTEALIEDLTLYLKEVDIPVTSFAIKLDNVKNGAKDAYLLTFDPETYYYACAYYEINEHNETKVNCCAQNYNWIGLESESEIKEYNGDQKLVAVFQINKTLGCEAVMKKGRSKETAVEHFMRYTPEFADGFNTSSPIIFDDSFVFLAHPDKDISYFSKDSSTFDVMTFSHVELEGELYLTQPIYVEKTDGTRTDRELPALFDAYYNELMDVMITGKYTTTTSKGSTLYYGLFKIEDIERIVMS